jgi:MFS family permease
LGTLADRIGPRPVILAGVGLTRLGTVPFALAGAHTNRVLLAAALAVRGAGLGGVTMAVMAAAFQGLDRDLVPHASSATRIVQQVGGSFGAAVLAVILQRQVTGHVHGTAGLAAGFGATFWWATAFTVAALLPALALPRHNPSLARNPPILEPGKPARRTDNPPCPSVVGR